MNQVLRFISSPEQAALMRHFVDLESDGQKE
jgi:hypothetical protein